MESSPVRSTNAWCGVVAIDKPAGWTSRHVVDRVAKIVRPAKAGHAGTLDPLATGVLVVAIGPATRLISYVQQGRKRYVGRFRLGHRSDTDDIDGQVVDGGDWKTITEQQVLGELQAFAGTTLQVPPQFSAVHVDGRRAYSLARQGKEFELQARSIDVFSIALTNFAPPEIELDIVCGSGTYIRSIGRDLGERLECGAVMTSLRRLQVGQFDLAACCPIEELDELTLQRAIQPAMAAVADLPREVICATEIDAIRQGRTIARRLERVSDSQQVALIDENEQLIAIAESIRSNSGLQPRVVLPSIPAGNGSQLT